MRGNENEDERIELTRSGVNALVQHVDDVILCADEFGTIRFVAGAAREVMGHDPAPMIGRNLIDFVHTDEIDTVLEMLERWAGRAGQPEGERVTIVTATGEARAVYFDAVITDQLGDLGSLVVTLRPANRAESDSRSLRLMALNGDRIVRLASAFLHVPYEDFEKGLAVAVEELAGLSPVTRVSIWLFEHDRAVLQTVWEAAVGAPDVPLEPEIPVRNFATLRRVLNGDEVHLSEPWPHGASFAAERKLFVEAGTTALMATPLAFGDHVMGMLMIETTLSLSAFDAMHATTIRSASAIIAEAYMRRAAERSLSEQARTDWVTGLANRWAFDEAVDRALRQLEANVALGLGLAMFDIDHFRSINDSLGHGVGDDLLAAVATRLTGATPNDATLARLGGDKFLLLIPSSPTPEHTESVVQAFIDAFNVPFEIVGRTMMLTMSAGVVHHTEGDATVAELMQVADLALRRAKSLGGDTVERDDPAARGTRWSHKHRIAELRNALTNNEFEVHYQGEWDLVTGALIGAEALVRWRHPSEGLLSASEFVPLAESIGIIRELGARVLHEACHVAAQWLPIVGDRPFELKVNVAAQQLSQVGLVDMISDVLGASSFPPTRLCLELTESTLLADPAGSSTVFHQLRNIGVGLAIDDFGTGYSSLLQLKRLPLSALKIDRAFVTGLPGDVNDLAIVEATLGLAKTLGYTTTAEGIETPMQRDALVAMGCRRAQGFLLSRPEDAGAFRQRLVDQSASG